MWIDFNDIKQRFLDEISHFAHSKGLPILIDQFNSIPVTLQAFHKTDI